MAVDHAQAGRLGVHQLGKAFHGAAHVLGQGGGGIVGRPDHDRTHQLPRRPLLAGHQTHLGLSGRGRLLGHRHQLVEVRVLAHYQSRHQLGHGCHGPRVVGTVAVEDCVVSSVVEDPRGRLQLGRRDHRQVSGRQRGQIHGEGPQLTRDESGQQQSQWGHVSLPADAAARRAAGLQRGRGPPGPNRPGSRRLAAGSRGCGGAASVR